jgi:hypothetical protein
MTERLHPNARLHLADRLSEQVEKASGEDLLAEAAQDFGDRRALAKEFDRGHWLAPSRKSATGVSAIALRNLRYTC